MPLIINIAGTSGAGKSTIARAVKSLAEAVTPLHRPGRRMPIGYDLRMPGLSRTVFLLGAYEDFGTGGCDTIKDAELNYDLILQEWRQGKHVVYEGLFVMNHTRGPRLWYTTKSVVVLHLQTPLAECLRRVRQRRVEVGNTKELNTKNTEGNFIRANNFASKMSYCGARRIKIQTEEGPSILCNLLLQDERDNQEMTT